MKRFEITVPSVNSIHYTKNITAVVMIPDTVTGKTSFALFTHGWGGNRFQHIDKMEATCESENRICVSAEYRMSGYDFDPVTGWGAYIPYDAGFMQLFDVLNCLRYVYQLYPSCDRSRTVHYGGSQGGWMALLSAIYAPKTFAAIYASSPLTRLTVQEIGWAGRSFEDRELACRNVLEHAELINTPLFLEHGTGDTTVPHYEHTEKLVARLAFLGKTHKVIYYPDGGHDLQPTISKLEAFEKMRNDFFSTPALTDTDDFTAGRVVKIPCGDWELTVDWSKPAESIELFYWAKIR
jgi:predicted esterase